MICIENKRIAHWPFKAVYCTSVHYHQGVWRSVSSCSWSLQPSAWTSVRDYLTRCAKRNPAEKYLAVTNKVYDGDSSFYFSHVYDGDSSFYFSHVYDGDSSFYFIHDSLSRLETTLRGCASIYTLRCLKSPPKSREKTGFANMWVKIQCQSQISTYNTQL
jgi:hypothetical protein